MGAIGAGGVAMWIDPRPSPPDLSSENRTQPRILKFVADIIILGGPNGAGKTTAAQVLLPEEIQLREFLNADEVARGLSPFNPEGVALAAGRLMLQRMQTLIRERRSFAFETTCSGRAYIPLLRRCKIAGWRVTLVYLWLPSPALALERVARRVSAGGHHIPDDVVVRRYWAGVVNMRDLYLPLADAASIFDNSDAALTLIAERTRGRSFVIHDAARWAAIERAQT
jgi:predicted ABC-type ATPase